MATLAPLDWRDCFKSPTIEEIRRKRLVPTVISETDNITVVLDEEEVQRPEWKVVLGSALQVLKVASFTVAVLSGLSIAVSAVVPSASALAVSSAIGGTTYVAGSTTLAYLEPAVEVAAGLSGWDALIDKILWIVDKLMTGVIIFSGVSWMFGNRTKAIELLLGSGVGYIIVRHHEDIKNFFALI